LDRPLEAWIVRDLPFCHDAVPHQYQPPQIDSIQGRIFRGLVRVEINPNTAQSSGIRRVVPGNPSLIDVEKHLPVILDQIRREIGTAAIRPD
jgi:hypothetical protein